MLGESKLIVEDRAVHSGGDYKIRQAVSEHDLQQVLALQAANLRTTLDAAERQAQGFVTLTHDLALLRELNSPWPHVVAVRADSDEVVAYALVMLREFRERLPVLEPMFERLDRLDYRGQPLNSFRFYIMGQVCVAKAHRGRGLVERMYEEHKRQMSPHFDLIVTEIARANPRSIRAHEKAGLHVIHEYSTDDHGEWVIVAMEL